MGERVAGTLGAQAPADFVPPQSIELRHDLALGRWLGRRHPDGGDPHQRGRDGNKEARAHERQLAPRP